MTDKSVLISGCYKTSDYVLVDVDLIDVGERRRERYRDIERLAAGINRVGMLEPIVVDETKSGRIRLVCGGRRLKAAKLLKWETIPARLLKNLSDEELRDIELEENENRDDLTEAERTRTFTSSKKLVANAKKAGEVLSAPGKTPNPKGGRPTKAAVSQQAIADALDTSRQSVERAEQHVATAEKFPFMQGDSWRQSSVLAVRERLEAIPEEERDKASEVLSCAKLLHPEDAVRLVSNMAEMKPSQREELYGLSKSDDPRDRELALTKAAKLPPMPDPRLASIDAALESLRRATKPFPNDPLTPRIGSVITELKAIRVLVKEVSFDARRNNTKEGTIQ